MKYLKNKNARRRGITMEMALLALMVLTAMSVISITATMIQVNKYEDVHDAFEEKAMKFNLETIGEVYFKELPDYIYDLETFKSSLVNRVEDVEGLEVEDITSEGNIYIGIFKYTINNQTTTLTITIERNETTIEKNETTFTIKEWKYN